MELKRLHDKIAEDHEHFQEDHQEFMKIVKNLEDLKMSWSHTKDITTKIIFLLCLSLSGEAKTISDVEDIINSPETVVTDDEITLDNSEYDLEKNNKGNIEVPWEVLQEYDLDKKKLTKNLKKIINQKVSIKGFMIPLDYSAKSIKEFLLVPYIPSCAHVPPPSGEYDYQCRLKSERN